MVRSMFIEVNPYPAVELRKVAEPLPATDRRKILLDYIVARIIPRQPQTGISFLPFGCKQI
jgi:hypothetical protein